MPGFFKIKLPWRMTKRLSYCGSNANHKSYYENEHVFTNADESWYYNQFQDSKEYFQQDLNSVGVQVDIVTYQRPNNSSFDQYERMRNISQDVEYPLVDFNVEADQSDVLKEVKNRINAAEKKWCEDREIICKEPFLALKETTRRVKEVQYSNLYLQKFFEGKSKVGSFPQSSNTYDMILHYYISSVTEDFIKVRSDVPLNSAKVYAEHFNKVKLWDEISEVITRETGEVIGDNVIIIVCD